MMEQEQHHGWIEISSEVGRGTTFRVYFRGYSAHTSGRCMFPEEGTHFLQKPYKPRELAEAVRACLDHRGARPLGGSPPS